jgi:hypothetical protein
LYEFGKERYCRLPSSGVPQLLLILNGEGYERNETSEYYKVVSGDAVFWEKDEWHETKSRERLTAIVIESKKLVLHYLCSWKIGWLIKRYNSQNLIHKRGCFLSIILKKSCIFMGFFY